MEAITNIFPPKLIRVQLGLLTQFINNSIIPFDSVDSTYTAIATTSNIVFQTLHTSQYTIDTTGIIDIISSNANIISKNDANAESKIQISGDGGITPFIDITDAIPGGAGVQRIGAGLWINNVQTGQNKLQIRILGRSTDGNPATIRINRVSVITFLFSKKLH